MSLHYILDGYNITRRSFKKSYDSLQEERDDLIRYLEQNRPQGSAQNKVTVVFDGKAGQTIAQKRSSLEVLFSFEDNADEKIKSIVSNAGNKKNLVVVSDDRDIKFAIKAQGARHLSVDNFMSKGVREANGISGKKNSKIARKEHNKHIPKALESQITAEFRKIWLKEPEG